MKHIRIVREAGGIGDIIRLFPMFRGLREKYENGTDGSDCRFHYLGLEYLESLIRLCPWFLDSDVFYIVPREQRRPRLMPLNASKYPYLQVTGDQEFDDSLDMYCPAYKHEADREGHVTQDRIELFCHAAGVTPTTMLPEIEIPKSARQYVEGWFNAAGIFNRRPLVGFQPFSTARSRNWPRDHWPRLAEMFRKKGWQVLWFDGVHGRVRKFSGPKFTAQSFENVAEAIHRCDLFVAPDSGLLHFAAAVSTLCVGIFGSTSGAIICKYYPTHTVIQGMDGLDSCKKFPCYGRQAAGYQPEICSHQEEGCARLGSIKPEEVFECAIALY